jgi:hypothetical protein
MSTSRSAIYLRRASRLQAPTCVMNRAAPSMETFFINMASRIWNIKGSVTPQNLCIIGVMAARNNPIPSNDSCAPLVLSSLDQRTLLLVTINNYQLFT